MKKINWTEVYAQQAPILKGVCRRYVKDLSMAEDMVHNAFEVAIQKIDTYKGFGSFEGWIKRIAINQCLLFLREKQKANLQFNEYGKSLLQEMKMDIDIKGGSSRFSREELLSVIDALPEKLKLVFNLYVIDGFKHYQIAEMLGISVGTSKSNLSRARKKAQKLLLDKSQTAAQLSYRKQSWVLLFLLRFGFIDHVFIRGFKGYVLNVRAATILARMPGTISLPFMSAISGKLIIGVVSVALISVGAVFLKKSDCAYPKIKENKMEMINDPLNPSFPVDTLAVVPVHKSKEAHQLTKKVIVHKTKIVRDTVYVPKPALP